MLRWKLLAAFAVVYVVWGSTYAAIRVGVATLPPAALAGVRFVIAGLIMTAFARALRQRWPGTPAEWRIVALMALLMIVLGNGLVTWAEQWVSSNQAALIVASSALWTAWLGTFGPRASALSSRSKLGLGLGFAGVALLFWPPGGVSHEYLLAQIALLASAVSWASGAIYARNHAVALPPIMLAALQMLLGGLIMAAIALVTGELDRWTWSGTGVSALVYLTLVGSCVAYATYFWLIQHTTPDRLSTIAYVTPAVATLLGRLFLDERLTPAQLAGMGIILTGVVLVVWQRRPRA